MRAAHRRKDTGLAFALGVMTLGAGCSRDPDIVERPVYVYSPRACPVAQSDAFSVLYASGDFEATAARPPMASVFLREVGRAMSDLPKDTRSLIIDVSQRETGWRGMTDIATDPGRPINVLVWPVGQSCRLTRDVERRSAMTLGVFGSHLMVAGGRSIDGSQVPHTYVGDLTTGAIERLPFGVNTRRSNPSITEFRAPKDPPGPSAALVAGGHDPDSGISDVAYRPIATAEVYVPKIGAPGDIGDFEQERIELSEARTRHGAVVLSNGETLLVGGRGPAGPLRSMEVVSPAKRRARLADALMTVAREKPAVLRLSNGEILVAGGLNADEKEIPTLEWFSPDASRSIKRPVELVTGRERAFVALEGGGALAVIRPEVPSADFKTVWVISAEGTLEPAQAIDPTTLDTIRLFAGSDGAPVLWTGRRWLRWSPWAGAFEPIVNAPLPATGSAPGPILDVIANGDQGLALWLDERGDAGLNVTGFRFATRSRFSVVPKPLLVSDVAQLAPDRLAGTPGSSIRFETERGLVLGTGASAFLTDVTFADFDLEVDVTGNAPVIVLRPTNSDDLEVGGAACAFAQAATRSLSVKRRAGRITVSVDGAIERGCPMTLDADVRVSLGLRGAQGATTSAARNLRVTRR